jgi:hypothetical protein
MSFHCVALLLCMAVSIELSSPAAHAVTSPPDLPATEQRRQGFEWMFKGMKQAGWDMSAPIAWRYSFTNASKEALEKAGRLLETQGYDAVNIYVVEKKSAYDRDWWRLQVERTEKHSVRSLDRRVLILHHFAEDNGLRSFDGVEAVATDRAACSIVLTHASVRTTCGR